ncbi:WD40 repeat domain-containing protein, partial [Seonamhaeicola sp.]
MKKPFYFSLLLLFCLSFFQVSIAQEIELVIPQGHDETVPMAQFSPDNNLIATASWDNSVKLWNAKTGRLLHTFKGHTDWVGSVSFSSDGELILTASKDKTAKIWSVKTGKLLHTLESESWVKSAQFSPDGSKIVTSSYGGTIIWDVKTGEILQKLDAGSLRANELAQFSHNGEYVLATATEKNYTLNK